MMMLTMLAAAGMICYSTAHQIPRDGQAKIKRSRAATVEFKIQTGYPKGRPGYVIDHIISLKRGGCDTIENMQWQTIEEAKAKDGWE